MSIQQRAVQVANLAVSPFVKIGTKVHTSAVQKQKVYDDEWLARVNTHKANGTDLAAETTNTYIADSFKLIAYRIERGTFEGKYIAENYKSFDYSNYKNWVLGFRFATRLLAVYLLAFMYGRGSVFPLISPESPFNKGIQYQNPNGYMAQHLG